MIRIVHRSITGGTYTTTHYIVAIEGGMIFFLDNGMIQCLPAGHDDIMRNSL